MARAPRAKARHLVTAASGGSLRHGALAAAGFALLALFPVPAAEGRPGPDPR
ncbi:hypothetical protein AB0C81_14335 [Streptomyces roseoverticillatus]|uniref:hypothetical protein n=1 Tax=Streptomyces roseoverticillatus TaxID=66429 RepID=UPI0033E2DC9A